MTLMKMTFPMALRHREIFFKKEVDICQSVCYNRFTEVNQTE